MITMGICYEKKCNPIRFPILFHLLVVTEIIVMHPQRKLTHTWSRFIHLWRNLRTWWKFVSDEFLYHHAISQRWKNLKYISLQVNETKTNCKRQYSQMWISPVVNHQIKIHITWGRNIFPLRKIRKLDKKLKE